MATTPVTELEAVRVISTGIRGGERTVADSPAPIDIIGGEQLLRTGRAELSEAISKLLPSFNFGTNIAGYNSVTRPLSNRGLGPAYTLVLVNGKRRHNGAMPARGSIDNSGANAVDIDLIPLSAVDHIEVLKDSAAAQYGSDAVAGVINIILKSTASGGHLEASYGELYGGRDGASRKLAWDQGFALGGEGGFLHLAADARKRGYAWWGGRADSSVRGYFDDAREAAWDRIAIKNGDPELEAFNLAYNAELPVGDTFRFYSHATYGERKATIQNFMRLATGNATIPELFPDGYYPINNVKDTDYQALFGARWSAAGWDWDLSTTYGRNRSHHSSDRTINPSLGPDSPTSFDNLAAFQFEQWVSNLDATRRFEGVLALQWPVQVSFGLEHRYERFRTFAGQWEAYTVGSYQYPQYLEDGSLNPLWVANGSQPAVGAQAVVTISPRDAVSIKRNNVAGYVDLGFDPSERWYIGLAGRFEHYDDSSGNTTSFKLNSRYELSDTLALRGTVGSGFRAPSLPQIGYTVTDNRVSTDAEGNVVPAVTRLTPAGSALAIALGGGALKPEKSRNAGLGLAWQPAPRTSVTFDAYLVDIDDRITLTSNIYDKGDGTIAAVLAANDLDSSTWVNFYTNAFDTRTRGLDLVADHLSDHGRWGTVRWNAALNWNKTTISRIKATPEAILASGNYLVGRDREGDITVASPATKLVLGANWRLGALALNLQTTRYGKVETLAVNASGDRSFGAKWITDLELSYNFLSGVVLSLGATNLFDVRPDANAVYSALGLAPYGNPPFSPAGGYWYTRLAYDF
ncbi:MAG: TonB-dependent receptor [Pseudomonas sp.]